jgi:DNA-binding NarL/FixJ family response regulator
MQQEINMILLDMNFHLGVNTGSEGLFWLEQIKKVHPDIPVVLFTAYGDIDIAVRGLKMGAADFVTKPWDNDILLDKLRAIMEKERKMKTLEEVTEEHMQKAIDHVRQAYPQTSVLVVSMPDRDQRTAEGIKTMKGVESLVAYQQILASDCHVGHFNLFEAMGGRESMKALVDQGLANKDYTHLSFAGGRQLATHLVESILAGYDNYKQ